MGRPPGRGVLSEEGIVEAARQIIAEGGTEALTMRVLSNRLGVSLGATYRRIASRDAILSRVALELFDRVEHDVSGQLEWIDRIRTMVVGYAAVFGDHPGMASFVMEHVGELAPSGMMTAMTSALTDAGLEVNRADAVNAAVFFYVGGTTASAVVAGGPSSSAEWFDQRFRDGLEVLLKGISAIAAEPDTVVESA